MTIETAADRMKVACDAIMRGDFMTAMMDLSPEAMAEAMQLAGGFTGVPMPESYSIDSETEAGGQYSFHVTFRGSGQQLAATVSWQMQGGAWKIVSMKLDGPPTAV